MAKNILGVIGGYFAMFLTVFLTFSGAYLTMGAENAFQPNSYNVSLLWAVVSFILSFVGALVGGFVCALIAGNQTAAKFLAGIVLILGLLSAVGVALTPKTDAVRVGNVPNLEAASKAQMPLWIALLNPLIGAVGVIAGARLKKN